MGQLVPKIDYQAIERERLSEIQSTITNRLNRSKDLGQGDSLRRMVLGHIVSGDYPGARRELDAYFEGNREFATFYDRAARYHSYCRDLINAIEGKRSFEGLATLPLAKQQEIYEKVVDHFEELKNNLKSIERQEKDAKLQDVRSTVWVIRAFSNSLLLVVAVAFIIDVRHSGLLGSFSAVLNNLVASLADWTFQLIGW